MKTTTGPLAISATIASPSTKLIMTTGIVTFAPEVPAPMLNPSDVSSLLIMITPIAPAFCALRAFTPN